MTSEAKKIVKTKNSAPSHMQPEERRQFLQVKVKALPTPIQNKIVVLKNIQLEKIKMEKNFCDEVYDLQYRYQQKYEELYNKRKAIIEGETEPDQQHSNVKDESSENDFGRVKEVPLSDAKGVPGFWLTVLRNTMITDMIKKHDEPALRRLIDVTVRYDVGHAFKLEFHFEANQFFDNSVLSKKYFLRSSIDQYDPFAYEGHKVKSCQGCDIDWKDKMNLTVKTNNNTPVESFFNFFNSPQWSIDNEDDDEYKEAKALEADYKIGNFLRVRIIPKAVLYFTGDIVDKYGDEDKD